MSDFLKTLGIEKTNLGGFHGEWIGSGPKLDVITPIDGSTIGSVTQVTEQEYDKIVARAQQAFLNWRMVPAPKRGELVRQLGVRLRQFKKELGALVTLEMGKIAAEGEGEVQEMIDICDFRLRLVTPALWPDNALRAPPASHVRAVAPARRRRRHQRVQLPRRRVVVE
jgi:aldehyde dehydrogenase (NAD+)